MFIIIVIDITMARLRQIVRGEKKLAKLTTNDKILHVGFARVLVYPT